MFSVNEFLDRAQRGAGVSSDYALAKALGVGRANVSNWRSGRTQPDERAIQRLCELSRDDFAVTLARIQALRAPNDEARAMWEHVAARLRQVVAVFVAACALLAASLVIDNNGAAFAQESDCVLCQIAKWLVIGLASIAVTYLAKIGARLRAHRMVGKADSKLST